MIESVYRASGLRVGLFTSPHLVSFRERIQVNRQLISEKDVVRLVANLREQSRAGVSPARRRSACVSAATGARPLNRREVLPVAKSLRLGKPR